MRCNLSFSFLSLFSCVLSVFKWLMRHHSTDHALSKPPIWMCYDVVASCNCERIEDESKHGSISSLVSLCFVSAVACWNMRSSDGTLVEVQSCALWRSYTVMRPPCNAGQTLHETACASELKLSLSSHSEWEILERTQHPISLNPEEMTDLNFFP